MTKSESIVFQVTPAGGPFHDPAMLVTLTNQKESLLLDSGTLSRLKTRDLLRVRWLCLSHLHIDHLIGFDHLLRVRLFSDLPLTVFGPPGTSTVIGHRLKGYAWNLTSGSPFEIQTFDLKETGGTDVGSRYRCHNQFDPETISAIQESPIYLYDNLYLAWHPVDHGVPCYCFKLEKHSAPKFSLEICQSLGLNPGPWVKQLTSGAKLELEVEGELRDQDWLSQKLLSPPRIETLGYLTDTKLAEPLRAKLISFFADVDRLICESAYLSHEADTATTNLHMTTHQVGQFAKDAGASKLTIFHLSRRHMENGPESHLREVQEMFPEAELSGAN